MGLRNTCAGVMLPFLVSMSAVFFRIIMPVMKPAYASMAVLTGMTTGTVKG